MEKNTYLEKRATNAAIIKRVSVISLIINVVLTALKLIVGAIFMNISVLSDAAHSASDLLTTILVIVAVYFSQPKADKQHNYGHEKIEPLLVLFFALILAGTGVLLGVQGVKGLITPKSVTANAYLIATTVLSIVSKEALYHYTIHYAKITKSGALKADAWHHRSDSLSSIAVLIGLVAGIFINTDLVESIAVVLIAVLIIKVAVQILLNAVGQLTDKAADEQVCNDIRTVIEKTEGVQCVDKLQTRLFGNAIYVDVEIGVDPELTVTDSHLIAEAVHDNIEAQDQYPIKHCNVHVNPCGAHKDENIIEPSPKVENVLKELAKDEAAIEEPPKAVNVSIAPKDENTVETSPSEPPETIEK